MRVTLAAVGVLAVLSAGIGGSVSHAVPVGGEAGVPVRQIGTYDYLASPDYDGLAPLRGVVGPHRIGLGTFNRIDGELVVMAGHAYRVGTDGTPRQVSLRRTTPFAQTVTFRPQLRRVVPAGTACADLPAVVDRVTGTASGIVAVSLSGRFPGLQFRSVAKQSQSYPPLADVVAGETVFDLDGARARLVGFRTGPDLAGASPVGIHLHGLTTDRRGGGHVLSCRTGHGVTMRAQLTTGIRILGR